MINYKTRYKRKGVLAFAPPSRTAARRAACFIKQGKQGKQCTRKRKDPLACLNAHNKNDYTRNKMYEAQEAPVSCQFFHSVQCSS